MKRKIKIIENNRKFRLGVLLVTGVFLITLWFFRGYFDSLSDFGYLGLFLVNLISSATVLVPLPGVASVALAGAVLQPVYVGLVSGLGASLGELTGYYLGYGGRGLVNHNDGNHKRLKKIEFWFQQNGFVTTLVFSMIPMPVFDFVGIFAGSLNYPIWRYWLATFIGRSIRNFLVAWAGAKFLPL